MMFDFNLGLAGVLVPLLLVLAATSLRVLRDTSVAWCFNLDGSGRSRARGWSW